MSDWYYAIDNEQKGPVNEAELKENLAANKIPADALVWKDGMDNWTPANQVPAFSFRQPPIPAKIQPGGTGPTSADSTKALATETPAKSDSTTPVDLANIIGTPETLEVEYDDAEKNKVWGILAYIVFFIPLIFGKDSPFAKYHANQGLALCLTMIVSLTVLAIGHYVPFIYFVFDLLHIPLWLAFIGLMVMGIINASAGKCVPLPVIGGIKLIK